MVGTTFEALADMTRLDLLFDFASQGMVTKVLLNHLFLMSGSGSMNVASWYRQTNGDSKAFGVTIWRC